MPLALGGVRWTVGGTTPSFTFAVTVVAQSPVS